MEGVETMRRTKHDRAARLRGELARDRGLRRVASAIDAKRRLSEQPARATLTKADPLGLVEPGYAYLKRTYD
jgi:hypothetical protein